MSGDPIDDIELPELVDLPVYREDYISQERVDELCRLVWQEKPDYIKQLVYQEKLPFPNNRSSKFDEKIENIVYFLRDEENAGNVEAISLIGMVDLTYEIDRRIRHSLDLKDLKPIGKPIAPGPEGPFPEIGDLRFHIFKNEKPEEWILLSTKPKSEPEISPERNVIYQKLCKEHPEVVFSYGESIRLYFRTSEAYWLMRNYFKEHLSEDTPKLEN